MNPTIKPFSTKCPDTEGNPQQSLMVSLSLDPLLRIPRDNRQGNDKLLHEDEAITTTATVPDVLAQQHTPSTRQDSKEAEPTSKRGRWDYSPQGQDRPLEKEDNDSLLQRKARCKGNDAASTRSISVNIQQNEGDKVLHPKEEAAIPEDLSHQALPSSLQQRQSTPPRSIGILLFNGIFPSPTQEMRKGGLPAEMVSPDSKPVTPNNGMLELGQHVSTHVHDNYMLVPDNNNSTGSSYQQDNNSKDSANRSTVI